MPQPHLERIDTMSKAIFTWVSAIVLGLICMAAVIDVIRTVMTHGTRLTALPLWMAVLIVTVCWGIVLAICAVSRSRLLKLFSA